MRFQSEPNPIANRTFTICELCKSHLTLLTLLSCVRYVKFFACVSVQSNVLLLKSDEILMLVKLKPTYIIDRFVPPASDKGYCCEWNRTTSGPPTFVLGRPSGLMPATAIN